MKDLHFSRTEFVTLETSYGMLQPRQEAEVHYTIGVDEYNLPYWFEIYCPELDWSDEGRLTVRYDTKTKKLYLVDYDGVFTLPEPIIDKLKEEFGIINNL
jgi:hypothetical protein